MYKIRIQAMTVNGTGPATNWILGVTLMHDLQGELISVFMGYWIINHYFGIWSLCSLRASGIFHWLTGYCMRVIDLKYPYNLTYHVKIIVMLYILVTMETIM